MPSRTWLCATAFAAALLPVSNASFADTLFITSARVDLATDTATFPLRRGVTQAGETVWYVVLDASSSDAAARYGANRSNKLANARGTRAVQRVRMSGGVIVFPATVDFAPEHVLVPGPAGFPPTAFRPGAVANQGYSPLVQLPDGTILNTPHLANASGQADKVVRLDTSAGRVEYRLTRGFANDDDVRYVSTEASDPLAAALEDVTHVPLLNDAPGLGNDGTDSSRAALGATVNGQLGSGNPGQQGFNSALLEGLSPRNALAWAPNQGRYSPIWDVHVGLWTRAAVAAGRNVALRDFDDFERAAEEGDLNAPDGSPFRPTGFVVNCPIVLELD